MFVVTTAENMGDMALCQEWIGDLGRDTFQYAFVLCGNMAPYIDDGDVRFLFESDTDIRTTVLAAARSFGPEAIIFASNSFWTIPGQKGAQFGTFPPELHLAGIPLLSFDPFELSFETTVRQTGARACFPAVPASVWALRYMSLSSTETNARHFCSREVFSLARQTAGPEVLKKWGADPNRKTLVFAVSKNRHDFIERYYPEYFAHLSRLFSTPPATEAQFLVVCADPIAAFAQLPNVVQIPQVPFGEFLSIVASSDLYLADSLISCIVHAFHLAVPALLLAIGEKSRPFATDGFMGANFFPCRVFPYGFVEICEVLEERFGVSGCYEEVEMLDAVDFAAALQRKLFDSDGLSGLKQRCLQWKSDRMKLPGPRETLDAVLASPPLPGSGSHNVESIGE